MPYCHFIGGNYWILKTTNQNRGNGIHVFKSITQLIQIVLSYVRRESEFKLDSSKYRTNKPGSALPEAVLKQNLHHFSTPISISKNIQFIIQKYIERPYLVFNRKFDIRVWVLINQDMEVFFCREGYLRTSAFEYELDDCEDKMIHLTNNAVQKTSKDYGRFEDGNQLSFDQFQEHIDQDHNIKMKAEGKPAISVRDDIVEDIKFVISKTIESVKRKIDANKRNGCFEILGYDFMVDNDLTVWLIEVNSNPCLDESSPLLKRLLPRMLDDAFKITIDKDFPNPLLQYNKQLDKFEKQRQSELKQQAKGKAAASTQESSPHATINYFSSPPPTVKGSKISKQASSPVQNEQLITMTQNLQAQLKGEIKASQRSVFPVTGYSNDENLWQKIMDIKLSHQKSGITNKNRMNIKVNDRNVRCKNCFFAPFEQTDQVFITNYQSYKTYKNQQKSWYA